MTKTTLPITEVLDPRSRPTITVEEAGELLGVSRSSAYEAARTGEIPSIRVGRRLVVPTAAMRRLLQLDEVSRDGDAA